MGISPGYAELRRVGLPVLVILLGVSLRVSLIWATTPFDADEALYATFARQISHEDNPLLIGSPVDKTPLAVYLTAFSFKLFTNPGEWAARLPNFYASVVSLAMLWALARRLYGDQWMATLATLFLALSPFDVVFAGTVFTDPQATLWILLGCLMAATGRLSGAGLFAGLAFATKQSALQFVPLIVAVGVAMNVRRGGVRLNDFARMAVRFALPLLVIITLTFLWGAARGPETPDWWALGVANNAPDRLIRSDEVLPRLTSWIGFLGEGVGGPGLLVALSTFGSILLLGAIKRTPRRRETAIDLVLVVYVIGYVLVYWLIAFNTYDRYAHTLVPLLGLLVARMLVGLLNWVRHRDGAGENARQAMIVAGILVVVMLPSALSARGGDSPLLAAREQYDGILEVSAYLNHLPPGTIIYDHWLGWHLGWYTGQHRPRDMWLRITYYPTPEMLVADALQQLDQQPDPVPRYFVVPDWVWAGPWLRALEDARFAPEMEVQFGHFLLYQLTP